MANTRSRRSGLASPTVELLAIVGGTVAALVVAGATLIAVVGSVFGALYESTDNLAVPVVTHAAYNVVLLLISYLAI